jgi:hypothetical protein
MLGIIVQLDITSAQGGHQENRREFPVQAPWTFSIPGRNRGAV